ncbi:bile acid:sodium symporter family protein [Algoriphagus namhaensis]
MSLRLGERLKKIGINGLLLGIVFSALMAYFFPELGSADSGIPWKVLTNVGISMIFFFYGVKLDPLSLRRGLGNWRLHLLIQSGTYVIFPLLMLLILPFLDLFQGNMRIGLLFLSALPSTVSASVVLVSIARGNLPAAIFNASISSLLGVFLTPFWMLFLTGSESSGMELSQTLGQLSLKILIPVLVGILTHRWLYPILGPHFPKIKYMDQAVIMAIVFTSFSDAFINDVFAPYSSGLVFGLILLTGVVYFLMVGVIYLVARFFGFALQDRITAIFCGAKKSLIQGVVMGKVIFPDPLILSIIILPVMIFHIQQLMYGSLLAGYIKENWTSEDD